MIKNSPPCTYKNKNPTRIYFTHAFIVMYKDSEVTDKIYITYNRYKCCRSCQNIP